MDQVGFSLHNFIEMRSQQNTKPSTSLRDNYGLSRNYQASTALSANPATFFVLSHSDKGNNILFLKIHFILLKPTGYVMHQQFNIQQLYALPTLYLCVLYLSENEQRLVPLIPLTDWFL